MKENRGKEVVDEGNRPEIQTQARHSAGDKGKSLFKNLDLGNLHSRRGKKAKHGSSPVGVVKSTLPTSQPSIQVFDIDTSTPIEITPSKTPPSKTTAPASSQPSQRISMNLIKSEDLAWGCFEKAVSNEDIAACYDISLKDFEHSGNHDLFKVCNFNFASFLLLYTFSRLTIIFVIYLFIGNVKIYYGVHASHRIGQDEDLTIDQGSRGEGRV